MCGMGFSIYLQMRMSGRVSRLFLIGLRMVLSDCALMTRFPQLYVGGEFVGGLDIVKEMVDSGEFDELVQTNGQAAESA
jgi:glutaredoxin-related protein